MTRKKKTTRHRVALATQDDDVAIKALHRYVRTIHGASQTLTRRDEDQRWRVQIACDEEFIEARGEYLPRTIDRAIAAMRALRGGR